MVAPKRSESRRRLCTAEDIQRLPLLKALVDRGHAIGMIAGLNSAQLEERLGIQEQADAGSGSGSVRKRSASCWLLVIGEVLHQQFAQRDFVSGTEMVASYGSLEEADGWSGEPVDVVLIECATLFDETILMVQSLTKRVGALRAVIVYQFIQQGTERKIDQGISGISGISALPAPVDAHELQVVLQANVSLATRAALPLPSAATGEHIPPRKFADKQFAQASQTSTTIGCECPQHLGNLLTSLAAFEKYSSECESRNAEDEALHRFLHRTTAQARSMMGRVLQEVIDTEGLAI